jgi:hypothetical protein
MNLPPQYRDLITSNLNPGEIYRCGIEMIREDKLTCDYQFTEALVYAAEVRYAIQVIREGPPSNWWNFGDPHGDFEDMLCSLLDSRQPLRLVFAGSGPYPITAALVANHYPDAEIVCVENNVAAYLLGEAVLERSGITARSVLVDAMDFDYCQYNAVIVAAMVRGKRALVEKILSTSSALIVVRSRIGVEHDRVVELPSPFTDDGTLDGRLA